MGVDTKAEQKWNFDLWSTFTQTRKSGPLLLGACASDSLPQQTCRFNMRTDSFSIFSQHESEF